MCVGHTHHHQEQDERAVSGWTAGGRQRRMRRRAEGKEGGHGGWGQVPGSLGGEWVLGRV